jgi:HD-like signal output (HDOD) protein
VVPGPKADDATAAAEQSVRATLARLSRTGDLPALPATAAWALTIARDPETDPDDLCAVIRSDVGLAARILRVANSVAYGRRKPARTLHEAVFTVGLRKTCDLVVATAARQLYTRAHPRAEGLWNHALAVATAAEELAPTQRVPAAEAFLPGLFHDVGRIVFLIADAAGLDAIEQAVRYEGADRALLEAERFGTDHAQAGAILVGDWGLASWQADGVRCHHRRDAATDGRALATVLAAADALVHEIGFGTPGGDDMPLSDLGLSADEAGFCRERVRRSFEIQNALLA